MPRLRIARLVLVSCSVAAAAAAISAWPTVMSASSSTAMVETWRMVGFATFAGLFAVLAARPAANLGLWLTVGANKLILSISAATWLADADGASQAAAWDGTLTLVLLIALLLARPWHTTATLRIPPTSRSTAGLMVGGR